jgi:hypothetical protein
MFVKAYQSPQGNKKVHFTRVQEALIKDVERAFGVLQSRFSLVRGLPDGGARRIFGL